MPDDTEMHRRLWKAPPPDMTVMPGLGGAGGAAPHDGAA
jgi:hypothetical protein